VLFHYSKQYPGYSHLSELISELGSSGSPVSHIFSVWWVIAGILLMVFAVGLYYAFSSEEKNANMASVLLMTYIIGDFVISGIFRDDHFNGGTLTLSSKIHVGIGAVGIFALIAFPAAMLKVFTKESNIKFYYFSYVILYIGILTTCLLFFRYYQVAYLTDLQGLWQRIMMMSFYVYFIVIATMMLKKALTADRQLKYNPRI
jgi:hypothetical protein